MAGNPFFSGRIPQGLHDRIQQHCSETGESKTQVLINALAAYLNHPVKESPSSIAISHQEFAALQEQVAALEKSIQASNQHVINTDNTEIGLIKEKIELLATRQNQVDTLLANLPLKLMQFEEQIKTLSSVITPDNADNKALDVNADLELIAIEGRCPSCHCDDMSAIPYESDDEVSFECKSCGWEKTYSLSAAKESGYKPDDYEEIDNRADNGGDNKLPSSELLDDSLGLPEFLNAANLARRLRISKSVISRRKSEPNFEEWSKEHDPDAIAWRYDRSHQKFFPM